MIQTAGLTRLSEMSMSLYFLILRRVILSIVCIQSLLLDFFFPSFCIISENSQGTRRGPELLVKNIPFCCGMQDALFSIWLLPSVPEMVTIQCLPAHICLRRSLSMKVILRMLNVNRQLSSIKGQVRFCCKRAP